MVEGSPSRSRALGGGEKKKACLHFQRPHHYSGSKSIVRSPVMVSVLVRVLQGHRIDRSERYSERSDEGLAHAVTEMRSPGSAVCAV